MVTVYAEGVDYSSTNGANWGALAAALKAEGKSFVGRYAVTDKSPGGRGITAAEYQAMKAAGIEVFVYWEAQTSWMLGGWQAGVNAANNAVANLRAAGLPLDMPVYYSHDIEPDPSHYDEVDQCLRGAASVVGFDAVGLYGGYGIIEHVADVSHTAPWFCQTYAWSGGRLHPKAHLHQYNNYGNYINGTDVDLVAALQPHYGQASDFDGTEPPPPPPPPKPVHPDKRIPGPDKISAQGHPLKHTKPNRFRAIQGGHFKTAPSLDAPDGTPTPYKAGRVYTFDYETVNEKWLFARSGSWAPKQNFEQQAR